jgi:hypothetical protein
MKTNKKLMCFRLILIGFIVFCLISLLFSCASSGHHHRRGKLSGAMKKASDDNKEDREVETEPDPDYYYDEEENEEYVYQSISDDSSEQYYQNLENENKQPDLRGTDLESKPAWFSIRGGTGILKGKDFFGLNHFNLALGTFPVPQNRMEFNAGFAWAPIVQTSVLKQSLDGGVILLNLGLNYKWFSTPGHTFLGQYFSFGFKYNYMIWSYKNPILADYYDDWGNYEGTDEISNDGLSGFEFYTGIGFHILQIKEFQIGSEISPGVIFWVWETAEGFENDVFSTFWYVKFKVLINFRIN